MNKRWVEKNTEGITELNVVSARENDRIRTAAIFSLGKIKIRKDGFSKLGRTGVYTYITYQDRYADQVTIDHLYVCFRTPIGSGENIFHSKGYASSSWTIEPGVGVVSTQKSLEYPEWFEGIKSYSDMFETPYNKDRWKHMKPIRPARHKGKHLFITGNSKIWQKLGKEWHEVEDLSSLHALAKEEFDSHFLYTSGCIINA